MTAPGYQITAVRGDQDNAEITGDEWGFSPLADRPHAPDLLAWLDAHTGDTDPDVWVLVTPADEPVGRVQGVLARADVVPSPRGYTLALADRLAPAGAHAHDEGPGTADPRVLEDMDVDALADYVAARHGLRDDVARLFAAWLNTNAGDWGDEDTVLTWGDLVAVALDEWRGDPS